MVNQTLTQAPAPASSSPSRDNSTQYRTAAGNGGTATAAAGVDRNGPEPHHRPSETNTSDDNIIGGLVVMAVGSLLLFWLPFLGPFIAGYAGGKKSGGAKAGVAAGILPAIGIVAANWWLATAGVSMLFVAFLFFMGRYYLIGLLLHSLALIAGAIIGGVVS
jgi:hypothetical protein